MPKKNTKPTRASGKRRPAPIEEHHLTAAERRAEGKKLRDAVPRESHAGWTPPADRRDPVEIVLASNKGRRPELVPIRHRRMLQSAFAFYRGTAAIMAADLARTPSSGLRVQACGDAHLSNFGGFATPERDVVFDVNDLDETLPAPWEWDLKRLSASLVLAGRHLQFKGSENERIARAAASSYRQHMASYALKRVMDIWYDKIDLKRFLERLPSEKARARVQKRVEQARGRSVAEHDFPKLAERVGETPRIKDNPPLIFHPDDPQDAVDSGNVMQALAHYRESLPEHVRMLFDRFELCDIAAKVVGVGSVGTTCLITLYMAGAGDPLFLQVKEANASVLEPYAGKSLHANHGQRVVVGQRLMQSASDIFLGWTHGTRGRHFYVRQLRDMKLSAIIEGMDGELLRAHGESCAWALARAHARSGDAASISGYIGSGRTFDSAVAAFSVEYADQAERDYAAFVEAHRNGRVEAADDF
jgi:uncharacterized protein (DUF2252 family)